MADAARWEAALEAKMCWSDSILLLDVPTALSAESILFLDSYIMRVAHHATPAKAGAGLNFFKENVLMREHALPGKQEQHGATFGKLENMPNEAEALVQRLLHGPR